MRIAITGCAGFIGAKVASQLLSRGHSVVGLDNYDSMYNVELKRARVSRLERAGDFKLLEGDVRSEDDVARVLTTGVDGVVHLAAQGGLRKSMDAPGQFISSNVGGFGVVIKATADAGIDKLVYASSGAVYGGTAAIPFREDDTAGWPLSLYGATKRADELLAFTYAHTSGVRSTGLRFSTVYGTDSRPDMAICEFTRRIWTGEPVRVHGQGKMVRDFVYGDDVARVVVAAIEDEREFRVSATAAGAGLTAQAEDAPWRVFNVATGRQVEVMEIVHIIEGALGREAQIELVDGHVAEVIENVMDVSALRASFGFAPSVSVEEGVPLAAKWYLDWSGLA